MTVAEMIGMRLRSRLELGRVWPDFLVWLAVSVATLGLGWLVVAGHFFRLVINSVEVVDAAGARQGRLVCDYDVEKRTGELVRWLLVCIVTLGGGCCSTASMPRARRWITPGSSGTDPAPASR